jgi:hypothetical protein
VNGHVKVVKRRVARLREIEKLIGKNNVARCNVVVSTGDRTGGEDAPHTERPQTEHVRLGGKAERCKLVPKPMSGYDDRLVAANLRHKVIEATKWSGQTSSVIGGE